jgi:hypothetical protein
MKKSFRPSKESRTPSRPSAPRPMGSSAHGSMGNSFHPSKKTGLGSKESYGGTPGNFMKESPILPGDRRGRGSRPALLIVLIVLFVCCVLALLIGGAVMVYQGFFSNLSFW